MSKEHPEGYGSIFARGVLTGVGDARFHWQRLIDAADQFFAQREYSVAVIVAHTACEVVIQRAVTKALKKNGLSPELTEHVMGFGSWAIIESKPKNLYKALTGDDKITDKNESPFWAAYHKSVEVRNLAVHQGKEATKEEAEAGVAAAKQLVAHVVTHNKLES